MEDTLKRIAKCHYNTKKDKRGGFRQVNLVGAPQELLAFVTPKTVSSAGRPCPAGSLMLLLFSSC